MNNDILYLLVTELREVGDQIGNSGLPVVGTGFHTLSNTLGSAGIKREQDTISEWFQGIAKEQKLLAHVATMLGNERPSYRFVLPKAQVVNDLDAYLRGLDRTGKIYDRKYTFTWVNNGWTFVCEAKLGRYSNADRHYLNYDVKEVSFLDLFTTTNPGWVSEDFKCYLFEELLSQEGIPLPHPVTKHQMVAEHYLEHGIIKSIYK